METVKNPKQPIPEIKVALRYEKTKYNKREVTKATLDYYRRSRVVRWAADRRKLVVSKLRKTFRKTVDFINNREVNK